MVGLLKAIRVGPIGPSPAAERVSPRSVPRALRSAPAQKTPPAPQSTATRSESSASNSRKASVSARAAGPSTALRASGRSITIVATVSLRSIRMAMVRSPAAGPRPGSAAHPAIYGFPRFEASPDGRPGYNGPAVLRGVEQIPWLYDAVCAVSEAFGLARWRRWLVAGARGRVLDLGCGTGRNLALLPPGSVAIGLDPSWASLQRARRRAPGVPLVAASAEALPFRDASFDTVLSGLVFCSVPDAPRGLLEARRVLAPRGRLRMLEHVRSTEPWKAQLQDWLQPAWTWVSGGCHPNRDTERAVEASGFDIEDDGRRAHGNLRRFAAAPREPHP